MFSLFAKSDEDFDFGENSQTASNISGVFHGIFSQYSKNLH